MSEITVAKQTYRIGALNAIQQFHVTRRLGPLIVVAGISIDMLRGSLKKDSADMLAIAPQVMDMLAKMSDDDANFVLFTCMGVVARKQGTAWAPCVAGDGRTLMFADLDMIVLVRLVIEVMKANLANFLTELDAGLTTSSSSESPGQPSHPSGSH